MAIEPAAIVNTNPQRIEAVLNKINAIKKSLSGKFFDLGELLKEVRDGGYHMTWGFANFGEWLESSGLDMKERSAYYLIKIIEMGKTLDIPREQLENVKISKLREIATLDPEQDGDKIRQLVSACTPNEKGEEQMSLDEVRHNVAKVKAGDGKIDTYVFLTIKITQTVKDEVIDPAIELARAEHGDTIDGDGEPQEISPGRAIELILGDYLAGADQPRQEQHNEPLPVEGQKMLPESLDAELAAVGEVLDVEVLHEPSILVASADPALFDIEPSVIDAEVVVVPALATESQEDDPLLIDAARYMEENPEATANHLRLHFRIGEIRAFKLYKAAIKTALPPVKR